MISQKQAISTVQQQNKHKVRKNRRRKIYKRKSKIRLNSKFSNETFETNLNFDYQNQAQRFQKSIEKIKQQEIKDPYMRLLNLQNIQNLKIEERLEKLNCFRKKRQKQFNVTLKITKQMRLQQNRRVKQLELLLKNYKDLNYLQVYNIYSEQLKPQFKEILSNYKDFNKKFQSLSGQTSSNKIIQQQNLQKPKEDLDNSFIGSNIAEIQLQTQISEVELHSLPKIQSSSPFMANDINKKSTTYNWQNYPTIKLKPVNYFVDYDVNLNLQDNNKSKFFYDDFKL